MVARLSSIAGPAAAARRDDLALERIILVDEKWAVHEPDLLIGDRY
jgi:hypothetical protein